MHGRVVGAVHETVNMCYCLHADCEICCWRGTSRSLAGRSIRNNWCINTRFNFMRVPAFMFRGERRRTDQTSRTAIMATSKAASLLLVLFLMFHCKPALASGRSAKPPPPQPEQLAARSRSPVAPMKADTDALVECLRAILGQPKMRLPGSPSKRAGAVGTCCVGTARPKGSRGS